jgi:uncharacterized protein YjbI with pentapeptide repeats
MIADNIKESYKNDYFIPILKKTTKSLNIYFQENKYKLIESYKKNFDLILEEILTIKPLNDSNGCVVFSLLRTQLRDTNELKYSVRYFNVNSKDSYELSQGLFYDAEWISYFYKQFCDELATNERKTMIKRYPLFLREMKMDVITVFSEYIIYLAKISLREYFLVNDLEEYNLMILVGDYISNCMTDVNIEVVKRFNNNKLTDRSLIDYIQDGKINKCTFRNLEDYDLSRKSKYNDISLHFSNLTNCSITNTMVDYGNFNGSCFNNCNLSNSSFFFCRIEDTLFKNCKLTDSIFYKCYANSDYNAEDVKNNAIDFSETDLTNTSFRRVELSGAIFKNAILNNTNFQDSNLKNAIFLSKDKNKVNISTEQIDEIIWV